MSGTKTAALSAALLAAVFIGQPAFAAPSDTCSVKIMKRTNPPGAPGPFQFSSDWDRFQGISLAGGDSVTKPVDCGTVFQFYEIQQAGWTLTNIKCKILHGTGSFAIDGADSDPAFQPGDTEVVVNGLDPGARLRCKYYNRAQ